MKKAKRMPSGTSEEENGLLDAGDGTDLEQHDSLPYDVSKIPQSSELPFKKEKMPTKVQKEESLTKKSSKRKMSRENQTATRDRTDSVTSGWSDIPQIRIIQTESAEKLDDTDSHLKTKGSKTIDNSRPSKTDNLQAKKQKHKETRTNSNKEYENKTKVLKREIDKSNKDVQEKSENENNKTKISGKVNKHHSSKTNESVSKYNSNNENLDYDIEEPQKDVKNKNTEKRIKKNQLKIREGKQIKSKQSKTKQVDPESEENSKTVQFKKHRNDIDNKDYLSNQSSSKIKPQKVSKSDRNNEEKHHSENRENDKDETDQENEEDNSENESDSEYEEDVDDEHGESEENDDNDIHIYDESNSDDSDEDRGVSTKIDNVTKGELKQTKSRKPHITNKRKTDSLSEESDASSQNTVKQSEMQLAKENEDNATIEANIKDKGEMASGVLSSKEQKNAKKALARFKIANVLLKESRRRSAAGLEEV